MPSGGPYRTPGEPYWRPPPPTRAEAFERVYEELRSRGAGGASLIAYLVGRAVADLADSVDAGSRRVEAALDRLHRRRE